MTVLAVGLSPKQGVLQEEAPAVSMPVCLLATLHIGHRSSPRMVSIARALRNRLWVVVAGSYQSRIARGGHREGLGRA